MITKKWINVAFLYMLASLVFFLSGCRQEGSKVAFLLYDANDTFISELMDKMERIIPENISYEIYDAANSQTVQNQQIISLVENGVQLLVINAVDRLACSSIVEKCANENVSVIFFNREPLGDAMNSGDVYYVGAAADSLGEKQADMVAALFGPDFINSRYDKNADDVIQLVILKGEQGHQDAEKRTENCVNRIKELGYKVEVLAIEVANWTRKQGYDAMRKLYEQYGDSIELVFSNNDDMALGAIDYLLEEKVFSLSREGYNQPFVIVGVDGTVVGLKAIGEGLLYGTVLNDSSMQAEAIIALMVRLLHDKDLSAYPYPIISNHYIYIDGGIIFHENVKEYTQ